jgi:hypothetical protein
LPNIKVILEGHNVYLFCRVKNVITVFFSKFVKPNAFKSCFELCVEKVNAESVSVECSNVTGEKRLLWDGGILGVRAKKSAAGRGEKIPAPVAAANSRPNNRFGRFVIDLLGESGRGMGKWEVPPCQGMPGQKKLETKVV